jgi:hypothetical protein
MTEFRYYHTVCSGMIRAGYCPKCRTCPPMPECEAREYVPKTIARLSRVPVQSTAAQVSAWQRVKTMIGGSNAR